MAAAQPAAKLAALDRAIVGYHFDYRDDEIAKQRELELGESLVNNATFLDTTFPPNARSLYFDPLNPPKGSIPNESIKWFSICQGALANCEDSSRPYWADVSSPFIRQGAIGDNYFINALSLLATQSTYIQRIMVSCTYASKGLYTFKFYKAGKWRYVHIDDYIPCRQSGRAHFARNRNPNETFAMLIEKAYAKLHGCYEAISYGVIEKVLQELTPAAGVDTLRLERIPSHRVCDEVWEKLDHALSQQGVVGCGRFVPNPVADNPAFQQGITVGHMYQVVDVCVSTAEPTEDFDALTVGMVCVRNLQPRKGRFTGRWSFGHKLWNDYKEIASDLRNRTRDIQFKRGLGPHPNDTEDPRLDQRHIPLSYTEVDEQQDCEPDTLDVKFVEQHSAPRMIQPMADDLHWIQIEDFVDIFNRVYTVVDMSFDKKGSCKRFVSKWLPGDYIVGSAGPPVIVTKEVIADEEDENDIGHDASNKMTQPRYRRTVTINDSFTENPMFPFSVNEPTRIAVTLYQQDKRWNVSRVGNDAAQVTAASFLDRLTRNQSVMHYPVGIGFLIVRLSGLKHRLTEFRLKKIAATSECVSFSQSATCYASLFPGRYAIIPFTHAAQDRAMDYALHFNYVSNQVEFEIEDPIAQRLQDKEPSEEGLGYEDEPDDNDLLRTHENDDDVSIMSYELEKNAEGGDEDGDVDEDEASLARSLVAMPKQVPLPRLLLYESWEYAEDVETLSMQHLFGEVSDMMTYVRTLKDEIRRLNGKVKLLTNSEAHG